jgi:hypothetical protein
VHPFVNRAGNAVWLALLATVGSIPLVTGIAAWSAAARVLREPEETGITLRWFTSCRHSIGGTWKTSLGIGVLSVVAIADIAYALLLESGLLRYPVIGVGGAIAVVLLSVGPFVIMLHARTGAVGRELIRTAALLSGTRVGLTVPLVLLGGVAGMGCIAIPPLTPVFLAVHLAASDRVFRSALASARLNADRATLSERTTS